MNDETRRIVGEFTRFFVGLIGSSCSLDDAGRQGLMEEFSNRWEGEVGEFVSNEHKSTLLLRLMSESNGICLGADGFVGKEPRFTLLVLKNKQFVDCEVPMSSQFTVMWLSNMVLMDSLRSLVDAGLPTIVDLLIQKESSPESSAALKMTKNRLKDASHILNNFHNTVCAPDIVGLAHPKIREVVMEGKQADDLDHGLLEDSNFIDVLQRTADRWLELSRELCGSDYSIGEGSANDEVLHWTNYRKALVSLSEQLRSPEIQSTVSILAVAGRYSSTSDFVADREVAEKLKIVDSCKQFVSSIPLDSVSTAKDLDDVLKSMELIASQLKKFRFTDFPEERFALFLGKISQEIQKKLLSVAPNLFNSSDKPFAKHKALLRSALFKWNDIIQENKLQLREVVRRRGLPLSLAIDIKPSTEELQESLKRVSDFRRRHATLRISLEKIHYDGYLQDLKHLYLPIRTLDNIRISDWGEEEALYNQRLSALEDKLTNVWTTAMYNSSSSEEMINQYHIFSPLMQLQPKSRLVMRNCQEALLTTVKNEAAFLETKLEEMYPVKEALLLKGLTSITAHIFQCMQITNRLLVLRERSAILLGNNWEALHEGKGLSSKIDDLRRRTNCKDEFDNWKDRASQMNLEKLNTPLLKIVHDHHSNFELSVNFDFSLGSAFKEVRSLGSMGFDIPSSVVRTALNYGEVQSHASAILELLQTFMSVVDGLDNRFYTSLLLKKDIEAVWGIIEAAMFDVWLRPDQCTRVPIEALPVSIKRLEKSVNLVLEKFEALEEAEENIAKAFKALKYLPYDRQSLSMGIESIQTLLSEFDAFQLGDTSGLVLFLNKRIEEIILIKARRVLEAMDFGCETLFVTLKGNKVEFYPGLNKIKSAWIAKLERIVSVVVKQLHITINGSTADLPTVFDFVTPLTETVSNVLRKIEVQFQATKTYLKELKMVEGLWLLQEPDLHNAISGDIADCYRFNQNLMHMRDIIEGVKEGEVSNKLLVVKIDSSFTQSREKIEYWQGFLINLLLNLCMNAAAKLTSEVKIDLESLEAYIPESSSFQHLYSLLVAVQRMKASANERTQYIKSFSLCESLFLHRRLQVPPSYIYSDQLDLEVSVAYDCLHRKEALLETKREYMTNTLAVKVREIENCANLILQNWRAKRETINSMSPEEALECFETFVTSSAKVRDEMRLVSFCSKTLRHPIKIEGVLNKASAEVNELIIGCRKAGVVRDVANCVLQQKWYCIDISAVSGEVATISETIEKLPEYCHKFKGMEELFTTVRKLAGSIGSLKEMKEACMKPRHWKAIFTKSSRGVPSLPVLESLRFSLDDVMTIDILSDSIFVKDIVHEAQREAILEESLDRMRTYWSNKKIKTFKHPTGIELVCDWSSTQKTCSEDLEELISMKGSIGFKFLEHECMKLESKLTAFLGIQLHWIEAQFNWLDLYGVVGDNTELSTILPHEATKFQNVTSDFQLILSQVFEKDSVIEIVSLSNAKLALENVCCKLEDIRISLNAYLEEQRRIFPRFYFMGNSDLLQLLGAGSDLAQVSRFMRQLFGSIESLQFTESTISGICSVEGEVLTLDTSIVIEQGSKPGIWLDWLESEIKTTLWKNVICCLRNIAEGTRFTNLVESHSFQVLLLTWQVLWTQEVEKSIKEKEYFTVKKLMEQTLDYLSRNLHECEVYHSRLKYRALIIEIIHGVAVVTKLCGTSNELMVEHIWNQTQKFYVREMEFEIQNKVALIQGGLEFSYGFCYIGVPERLIYTPTLEKCFSALGVALSQKYGGCLFGPAGTGKTETIKALSQNFGRMIFVFNCDDAFDFQAMTRLLSGIAQVGAWGCFDEMNRMDEATLSSLTGHVERIQSALLEGSESIHVMDSSIPLHKDTAFFITLNPGYKGRSNLPENLRKRFREISMKRAEKKNISKSLIRIIGLHDAGNLSRKLVSFLSNLQKECSLQKHYDFGLRCFKKILATCVKLINEKKYGANEESLLSESISRVVLPSLSIADERIFMSNYCKLFAPQNLTSCVDEFHEKLRETCRDLFLEATNEFIKKCTQLFNIQKYHQATIIMGRAGFGKTAVWRATLETLKRLNDSKHYSFVIDTKTLSKDSLYGELNKATLEWKDGVFTKILREANGGLSDTFEKSIVWIIFDSDLDPEYTEVLNSALDDNKILTLPTGERLEIPENVRIVFEAPNVDYATPATITRCAVVWLPEPLYEEQEHLHAMLAKMLESQNSLGLSREFTQNVRHILNEFLNPMRICGVFSIAKLFEHGLDHDSFRATATISKIITHSLRSFNSALSHASVKQLREFLLVKVYNTLINTLASDTGLNDRGEITKCIYNRFETYFRAQKGFSGAESLYIPRDSIKPAPFQSFLKPISLRPDDVMKPNLFIQTLDTMKYEMYLVELLESGLSPILCGPPGSGKTTILNNVIRTLKDYQVVGMNFSRDTTISNILDSLKRHTTYIDGPKGLTLSPKSPSKTVVLFCDEINLPSLDKYGSQSVILFLRLLIEKNGFWRPHDNRWTTMERIQIAGACNPSTDSGRVLLSPRFLRHTPILLIDHPSEQSLIVIYKALFEAILQLVPHLQLFSEEFSKASVSFYLQCKNLLNTSTQAHYIFTPRELTRWVRGLYTAIRSGLRQEFDVLLRAWVYEAKRIFLDRLVNKNDEEAYLSLMKSVLEKHFPDHKVQYLEARDLLFSSWISDDYSLVEKDEIYDFLKQRLKTFGEEQIGNELFIHEEMVNHLVGIDRILRQSQGHAMLIGPKRTGKATMIKFVSWLNGHTVMQPALHRNFGITDFDAFLRDMLNRCTIDEERVCVIINESCISEPSFLERMNTLLANCDIPDLFKEEQYDALILSLQKKTRSLGLAMESEQELYAWFIKQISKNLHVIFTMCDSRDTGKLILSPAMFNRCIIMWMGSWSISVLRQISNEIIQSVSLGSSDVASNDTSHFELPNNGGDRINEITNVLLKFHTHFEENLGCASSLGAFLDALRLFEALHHKEKTGIRERRLFFVNGIQKLNEAICISEEMGLLLETKAEELRDKELSARKTLDEILLKKNEAERKRDATMEIKNTLVQRESEAFQRRLEVERKLDAFQPIMLEAQRGVQNIKKQQLTEIRSMTNPPTTVKITMDAVCSVLGYRASSWREVQHFIRSDEFIYDMVHFEAAQMLSNDSKKIIEDEFLKSPAFTYEKVHRASKACGPLYRWVHAQVEYSELLEKVNPLRDEVRRLEQDARQAKANLSTAEDTILELEQSINQLKIVYSLMVRDTEAIKIRMEEIKSKSDRSKALIEGLSSEKSRWERTIDNYRENVAQLAGDCILSAVYYSYAGTLDQKKRKRAFEVLKEMLDEYSIKHKRNYSFVTQNLDIEMKTRWVAFGVPDEQYFLENLILTLEPSVTPYIIDPDNKILQVLTKCCSGQVEVMSFSDNTFLRKITNAVKFGKAVVVQNSQYFDPIISNLIFSVCQRSGGHGKVRIGELELSASSDFRLFLHTNDAKAAVPDILQSWVRVIDFSLDTVGIETQAVRMALKCDAPEIEERDGEITKLNGVYKAQLKKLEHQLLKELNASTSNIVENDELNKTLKNIKRESQLIEKKLQKTQDSILKGNDLIVPYSVFGYHCSSMFTLLIRISAIHWFYEFPPWLFTDCLKAALVEGQRLCDVEERVKTISWNCYTKVYSAFSAYLSKDYKTILAVLFHLMFHSGGNIRTAEHILQSILRLKSSESSEGHSADYEDITTCSQGLRNTVEQIANQSCMSAIDSLTCEFVNEDTLDSMVSSVERNCILVASEHESDFKVIHLAHKQGQKISVISLGSRENEIYAEKEICRSASEGGWLLLQNIQMSMPWVTSFLANAIENLPKSKAINGTEYKIFMTCNVKGEPLPLPLLQTGYKKVFEKTPRIITLARDLWNDSEVQCEGNLRKPVFDYFKFLLALFHAMLEARNRLVPVGFKKQYDFNECDFDSALNNLKHLVTRTKDNNSLFNCDDLHYTLGSIIYGGKVDDDEDFLIVQRICARVFSTEALQILEDPRRSYELLPGLSISSRFLNEQDLFDILNSPCEPSDSYISWLELPTNAIQQYDAIKARTLLTKAKDLLVE